MFPIILGSYDLWILYFKVTFDGDNKLIIVNEGETTIDVETDIYSAWKQWSESRDYLKYDAALRNTGGDPLPGGDFLGATFFLINGWRIFIAKGLDDLTFTGNIFTEEGDSAFVTEEGVQIAISRVSNLIDKPTLVGVSANARVFV